MEVQFTCECGQVMRANVGAAGGSVQCPTCGKMLTVPGTTAAPYGPAGFVPPAAQQKPTSGKAVAALVFGLCSVVPGLGVLAAPVGIALGIAVLVKKLQGKGLGIAGIATGAGGLLFIQTPFIIYVIMMVMFVRSMTRTFATMAATMPTTMAVAAQLNPPVLADREIDRALRTHAPAPPGADDRLAALKLNEARDLYGRRLQAPGNYFQCLRAFQMHLACRNVAKPQDPRDARRLDTVRAELKELVRRKLDEAARFEQILSWKQAAKRYAALMQIVPDEQNRIHQAAKERKEHCDRMQKAQDGKSDF